MSPERRLSATFSHTVAFLEGGGIVLEAVEARCRLWVSCRCGTCTQYWLTSGATSLAKVGFRGRRGDGGQDGERQEQGQQPRSTECSAAASFAALSVAGRAERLSPVVARLRRWGHRGGRVRSLAIILRYYPLKSNELQASSDFFDGNQFALAGAGANLAGLLPGFRRGDVALPERPGPALRRPYRVDGAALFAVVEDAIAVALLAESPAAAVQRVYSALTSSSVSPRNRRWRPGRRR